MIATLIRMCSDNLDYDAIMILVLMPFFPLLTVSKVFEMYSSTDSFLNPSILIILEAIPSKMPQAAG